MENSEQVITIVEAFLSYYPLKQGLKQQIKHNLPPYIHHFYPTIH